MVPVFRGTEAPTSWKLEPADSHDNVRYRIYGMWQAHDTEIDPVRYVRWKREDMYTFAR